MKQVCPCAMNSRNVPSTCNMLTSPWVPTKFQWEVFRDGHMEPVENADVPNAVPKGPKVLFFLLDPGPFKRVAMFSGAGVALRFFCFVCWLYNIQDL